jgi:hypothetical protein
VKSESIENIVVDEIHGRTYVVMADRILTDGELYRAIRIEILRRGNPLARGERLVISNSSSFKSKAQTEAPPEPRIVSMEGKELK